ncbi:MAG: Hpt domain-containing protein [Candidatus Riflebacteria bacterium]|nr:Hpt domain-containing protein [Candidatus Riflebacteria bacterium]
MTGPQELKGKILDFVALLQAGQSADRPFVEAFSNAGEAEDADASFFPEFIDDFRSETAGILDKVRSTVGRLGRAETVAAQELVEAYRLCHMLKGSSATMGFNRLSYLAHGMERIFEDLRGERLQLTHELVTILQEGMALIDEAIAAMKPPK